MTPKKPDLEKESSSPTPLSEETTDKLLKALLIFSRTVEHVLEDRAIEEIDVTLSRSKVQVIRILGQRGTLTATQIARFLGVSKPAVTQFVDALAQRELVTREQTKQDRRGVKVSLTEKGKHLFRTLRARQRHLVRNGVRHMTTEETETCLNLLQSITETLARADHAYEHFCLQCGGHEDGSCVLVGGDAVCLFLQYQSKRSRARLGRKA